MISIKNIFFVHSYGNFRRNWTNVILSRTSSPTSIWPASMMAKIYVTMNGENEHDLSWAIWRRISKF